MKRYQIADSEGPFGDLYDSPFAAKAELAKVIADSDVFFIVEVLA